MIHPGLASAKIDALGSSLRHGGEALNLVPDLLRQVLEDDLWRDFETKRHEQVHHDRFQSFVETAPLKGLGASMELVDRIVGTKDPDLLRLLREAKKGKPGRRPPTQGILDESSRNSQDHEADDADRLARKAPELYEQVREGELTINAAAVVAGFRPHRISVNLQDPESAARTLRAKASPEFVHALIRLLEQP